MWPHRWLWLDLWTTGHPKQMKGQAECLGGFPVLPEPVPGALRSQMSQTDSHHNTGLSSLGPGAGWGDTRAHPLHLLHRRAALRSCLPASPDSTVWISKDLFLFFFCPCLGQVIHVAPCRLSPLGSVSRAPARLGSRGGVGSAAAAWSSVSPGCLVRSRAHAGCPGPVPREDTWPGSRPVHHQRLPTYQLLHLGDIQGPAGTSPEVAAGGYLPAPIPQAQR